MVFVPPLAKYAECVRSSTLSVVVTSDDGGLLVELECTFGDRTVTRSSSRSRKVGMLVNLVWRRRAVVRRGRMVEDRRCV